MEMKKVAPCPDCAKRMNCEHAGKMMALDFTVSITGMPISKVECDLFSARDKVNQDTPEIRRVVTEMITEIIDDLINSGALPIPIKSEQKQDLITSIVDQSIDSGIGEDLANLGKIDAEKVMVGIAEQLKKQLGEDFGFAVAKVNSKGDMEILGMNGTGDEESDNEAIKRMKEIARMMAKNNQDNCMDCIECAMGMASCLDESLEDAMSKIDANQYISGVGTNTKVYDMFVKFGYITDGKVNTDKGIFPIKIDDNLPPASFGVAVKRK